MYSALLFTNMHVCVFDGSKVFPLAFLKAVWRRRNCCMRRGLLPHTRHVRFCTAPACGSIDQSSPICCRKVTTTYAQRRLRTPTPPRVVVGVRVGTWWKQTSSPACQCQVNNQRCRPTGGGCSLQLRLEISVSFAGCWSADLFTFLFLPSVPRRQSCC